MPQIIATIPEDRKNIFRRRSLYLLLFLTFWAFAGMVHVFYYSRIRRRSLISESDHIAMREGILPAPRGRIIAQNGRVLAWSVIRYDLVSKGPCRHTERLSRELAELFPGEKTGDGKKILRRDLSPGEILSCGRLLDRYANLVLVPVLERRTAADALLREEIGRVENGHGVSGLEKRFDAELAGRPGRFTVMFDRKSAWIGKTIRITEEPVPGKDVVLTETLPGERSSE